MQVDMEIVFFIVIATVSSLVMSTTPLLLLYNTTVLTVLTTSTASTNSTALTVSFSVANATTSRSSPSNFTPLPSLFDDLFVDRARMGLVPYKEENTLLHIEYFDTPFERQYYKEDIKHMISMSVRDTRNIIRPYHFHRFQQLPNSTTFRLHCKFMLNFIDLGNKTWVNEYQMATNLIAYYRRLYENGDHTDLVCYFVDTVNQTESDCLLRLVSNPNGEPFPVVEFSTVSRRLLKPKEPKVSHYHPHQNVYCHLMELILKLKFSTSQATTTVSFTTTASTEMPKMSTTPNIIITSIPSVNLTTTFESVESVSSHFTMNATVNSKEEAQSANHVFWEIIICAPIFIFGMLFLGGYLYKRKEDSRIVLDDSNIEFEVIQNQSGDSRNNLSGDESFV